MYRKEGRKKCHPISIEGKKAIKVLVTEAEQWNRKLYAITICNNQLNSFLEMYFIGKCAIPY